MKKNIKLGKKHLKKRTLKNNFEIKKELGKKNLEKRTWKNNFEIKKELGKNKKEPLFFYSFHNPYF